MNPREESIIEVDDDVRTVAAFMMANMPAARLVAVAKAIGEMAPLWGHYPPEPIQALRGESEKVAVAQEAIFKLKRHG